VIGGGVRCRFLFLQVRARRMKGVAHYGALGTRAIEKRWRDVAAVGQTRRPAEADPMPVPDAARHGLLFGPYRTPVFKYGDVVICDARGQVEIVGLSGGRISWSIGTRGRAKALVLCGALAKAVQLEAAVTVAYWWGVSPQTVTVWRRASRRRIAGPRTHPALLWRAIIRWAARLSATVRGPRKTPRPPSRGTGSNVGYDALDECLASSFDPAIRPTGADCGAWSWTPRCRFH
jgi:hypothetical protein